MKKEPLGLYIFRFLVGCGLLAFMLMLYWSSTIVESDVKTLILDVSQLKNELADIRSNLQKIHMPVSESSTSTGQSTLAKEDQLQKRPHIDPSLPNLLQDDPFYNVTLPKLLGPHFKPQGTFRNAYLGKPDNLHPFANWAQVVAWTNLCSVSLARLKFGIYETFAPDMAIKIEERLNKTTKTKEFWIHLRDNVFWQPLQSKLFSEDIKLAPHFLHKHPVTSHDFKFYYDAMMNAYNQEPGAIAARTYFGDIDSLEIVDDLTFIVRWKHETIKEPDGSTVLKPKYIAKQLTGGLRPLASFVYKYFADGTKIVEDDSDPNTYLTNSVWAQNFAQHWAKNIIVSCGPWIFEGMTDRQISFKRNPDHYFPLDALAENSEWQFKDTPDAIWQLFKSNQLDTYDLRPGQILELEEFLLSPKYKEQAASGAGINRIEYQTRGFYYIGWNEAKPYFQSKKVRQALTMAIDRQRIIRQNLNGLGVEITGPFYSNSPAYDSSIKPWPYDIQRAKRLLEEEGWFDSDGDGIIDKKINGQTVPFVFSLTYFVKSPTGKTINEYVATALKELGIQTNLNGVDIADLSASFDNKSFDAIYIGWMLATPPEDPKQVWYSKGSKEKGSSNAIGFANPEADQIIDTLEYEDDPKKRIELYHRFDAIIHEEAPYTFIYSPKTVMLYRDYLQNVFIPADRQDLIPGANIGEPDSSIFWLKTK